MSDEIEDEIVDVNDFKLGDTAEDVIVDSKENDDDIPPVTNDILIKQNNDINKAFEDIKKLEEATVDKLDDEIIEGLEDAEILYAEFSNFLETKADIKQSTGVIGFIPTGIKLLDTVLGGGFAIGALNIIIGNPGSGKSMLAMQAMSQGQKMYEKGKFLAAYCDSEHSTTTKRLFDLGVRTPSVKPYSDSMSVEKVFKVVEGMSVFKRQKDILDIPSIVVWDSIANSPSEKELEADDLNSVLGYKARLLSFLIPKYVDKMATHNVCMIAINQMSDKIQLGNFAPAKDMKFMTAGKDMPGGNKLKYNAFHLIECKVVDVGDKYGFDGIIVEIKAIKNKFFPPNLKIKVAGDFVRGFDNFWTNYMYLCDTKYIQVGTWNTLKNYNGKKFQTKSAKTLYEENEEFRKAFDEAVDMAIENELINKYKVD